jgi:hypothetical protein
VVSNNHDDDIIDDYEEVKPDKGTRRIESGHGGQVPPPGNGGPDQNGERPKGKISKSQAKLIWIICIAVTVLGLGAVGIDLFLDPLERRKHQQAQVPQQPQPQPKRKKRQPELTEHQLLARTFAVRANEFRTSAMDSAAHEEAWEALQAARRALSAAQEDRADTALWAEAWRTYYRAAYAVELFGHVHPYDDRDVPLVSNLQDNSAMEDMTEDELNSEVIQRAFGYYLLHSNLHTQVENVHRPLRELAVAANVRNNEQYKEELAALKERYNNARSNQVFDPEDLARHGVQPAPQETEPQESESPETESGETEEKAAEENTAEEDTGE